jgi:hypothetical protein
LDLLIKKVEMLGSPDQEVEMLDCTRRKRVEGMKNKFTCIGALGPYIIAPPGGHD